MLPVSATMPENSVSARRRPISCRRIRAITRWQMPMAMEAASRLDPPEEMNSSGMPVMGIRPDTPPTFSRKCRKMYVPVPARITLLTVSRVFRAYPNSLYSIMA